MGAVCCGHIAASKICSLPKVVKFSTQYYYISYERGHCPCCCKRTGASAPIAPMVPLPMMHSLNYSESTSIDATCIPHSYMGKERGCLFNSQRVLKIIMHCFVTSYIIIIIIIYGIAAGLLLTPQSRPFGLS